MSNKKRTLTVSLILLFVIIFPLVSSSENYDDVLLVTNNLSDISMQIGNYFAQQRNITYWVNLSLDPDLYGEVINYEQVFTPKIRTPIENYIINNNLQDKINYIITTKGVPLRHDKYLCEHMSGNNACASVDNELVLILGPYNGSIGENNSATNPYFNKSETFNHSKFGIYLVTRLTGFDWNDIKQMIDNATISDDNGMFVLDR